MQASAINGKTFALIASIALVLAFTPLTYELIKLQQENEKKACVFDVTVQISGFTEPIKVWLTSKTALILYTFENTEAFRTSISTDKQGNVSVQLLNEKNILLWENVVDAKSTCQLFFSNSTAGVNYELVKT